MNPDHDSPESDQVPQSPKRKADSAGLNVNSNGRPVKRRASKACQCCRARKVRCNVVEHGAPCTNCRLDEVPCIVTESKRRKKHPVNGNSKPQDSTATHPHLHAHGLSGAEALANGSVNPIDITNPAFRRTSDSGSSVDDGDDDHHSHHVPHALYQNQNQLLNLESHRRASFINPFAPPPVFTLLNTASIHGDLTSVSNRLRTPPVVQKPSTGYLPAYIKPLPSRITEDDVQYLWKKGALSVPDTTFRNALLRAYIEFVHPFMPLIELHEFLSIIDRGNGENGKVSLVLFQAIMFAGTAFVDMSYLHAAGYSTRKSARKAFYQKARLLYDFDYEGDRVALVQSLLLMTYWYETPDDQKDTWHWMGVAISLAHTIGLHRDPEKSNMDAKKQRLWKRIWWSCFMRDRLVALGMRRPTRIKDEDYDVPMLELGDFEIQSLSSDNTIISPDCTIIRDTTIQTDLALMCIAKAKLCLCISHVLAAQYSVLVRDHGMAMGQDGNVRSSVMLFPKKLDQGDEVKLCDTELTEWSQNLPLEFSYTTPTAEDLERGGASLVVQRSLLHMIYYATLSALHRPQVLPSAENATLQKSRDLQDVSRRKVRDASKEITRMSADLHNLDLERYLPTTGVTVLLPAIIIHLLDIKSASESTRKAALQGFSSCMQVLEQLRDNYAAADFATQFLDAAIRKADIDAPMFGGQKEAKSPGGNAPFNNQSAKKHVQNGFPPDSGRSARLTPPPDGFAKNVLPFGMIPPLSNSTTENHIQNINHINSQNFDSATTPPNSDASSHVGSTGFGAQNSNENVASSKPLHHIHNHHHIPDAFDDNFDALINFDVDPETLDHEWPFAALEEGMHGESGGFMMDMDWMRDSGEPFLWGPNGNGMGDGVSHSPEDHSGLKPEEQALFLLQDSMGGNGIDA